MSRAIITESKLTAIADAIRSRFGVSGSMTVDEMAETITSKMPANYQQVEYIESTGTQCIKTNIRPTNNTRVKIHFYTPNTLADDDTPFGEKKTTGTSYQYNLCVWQNVWYFDYGTKSGLSLPYDSTIKDYVVDINKNEISFNGTTRTITDNTFTASYPIFLFMRNANGAMYTYSSISMRLYSFEVFEDGVKIADFIPCYRKLDNEIGLYDILTDTFYTNAGTGTFTKGADV